jgi:hypothetical protein
LKSAEDDDKNRNSTPAECQGRGQQRKERETEGAREWERADGNINAGKYIVRKREERARKKEGASCKYIPGGYIHLRQWKTASRSPRADFGVELGGPEEICKLRGLE